MDIFVNTHLFRHVMRLLDRSVPIKAPVAHVMSKPLCTDKPITQPFPRSTPEAKGISSSVISAFLHEAVNDCGLDLHGVTIIKDGSVICQAQIGPYRPEYYHACHSLSKSVTATAIGMLIDEGKLSLDSKVTKLLEKRVPVLSMLGYRTLTVRHLLTMTSGASFAEVGVAVEKNWLRAFFESGVTSQPGKKFHYNSLNTYVLSCIVKEVSGQGLCKYLKKRLFDPLGITNYSWELSPEGIEAGGWGLYLCREDAAKLGQLYLDKGVWNGKRIISEDWVELSTKPWVRTPSDYGAFDYGYHIWNDKKGKSFLFNGMFCQDVLVLKEKRIVIATNGGVEQLFQQSEYYKLIDKYFAKDFVPRKRTVKLKKLLKDLKTGGRRYILPIKFPSDIKKTLGITFKAEDYSKMPLKGAQKSGTPISHSVLPIVEQLLRNSYATGIRSITLNKEGGQIFLDVEETDGIKRIPISIDKWKETVLHFGNTDYRAASYATISKNEDGYRLLKIKIAFPEVASSRVIKIYFKKSSVLVRMSESPGMGLIRMFADELEGIIKKNKIMTDFISLIDSDAIFCKLEKRFEGQFLLYKEK